MVVLSSSAPAWCCPSSRLPPRGPRLRSSHVGLLLGLPPLVGFLVVGPAGRRDRPAGRTTDPDGRPDAQVAANTLLAFAGHRGGGGRAAAVGGGVRGELARLPDADRDRGPGWSCGSATSGSIFTLLNPGIGIGGIVGGIVDVERLASFQAIYPPTPSPTCPRSSSCSCRSATSRAVHHPRPTAARAPGAGRLPSRSRVGRRSARCARSSPPTSATPSSTPACRRSPARSATSRPAAWAGLRREHPGDRGAPAGRAAAHRGTPAHRVIAVMSVVGRPRGCCSERPTVSGTWARPCSWRLGRRSSPSARRCCSRRSRRWSTSAPRRAARTLTRWSSGAFQLAAIIAPPLAGFLVAHDLGAVYIGSAGRRRACCAVRSPSYASSRS